MAWIGSNPIINIRDENIKIGQQHETPKKMEQFVLKMLRYDIESSSPVVYENHRKDAVAMEQLTASPHVMDVYGFCGHSVVTEVALGDSSILLKRGMNRNKKDDDDYYGHPKEEQTLLSSFERLVIARDVAQGLMDIHRGRTSVVTRDDENSYGGGEVDVESNKVVMVHNDINPANVVTVEGGRLKFNDFNLVVSDLGFILIINCCRNIHILFSRCPHRLDNHDAFRLVSDCFLSHSFHFRSFWIGM